MRYKLGEISYECSIEAIKRFKRASTEWKLNWLEEVNRLTFKILTSHEKEFGRKIRRGEI
jgi:hypothetical protein